MLALNLTQKDTVVATCIRALPDEGCGLLLGNREGVVFEVMPSANVAQSAKLYEIDSRVMLRASRRAEQEGLEVIGVFHSHTHSEAYPSATDIALAIDPNWHYVLVSLSELPTVVRSFHIVDARAIEEEIALTP